MQKFEILYNNAFSANTDSDAVLEIIQQENLYDSQQNVNLNQEYFVYTTQNGVSIVNDLNVKAYLDKPENEKIAVDFINYLRNLLTLDEFRDLFYDNKKLADFFNSYYRKFINFSNQGQTDITSDPNINLIDKKNSLFNEDEKYLKTNGLTNYYTNTVDNAGNPISNNYSNVTRPSDFLNFSGDSENYYINIQINKNEKIIFTDDFSEYFKNTCEGIINYSKYTYKNSTNLYIKYVNLDELTKLKNSTNSNFGPSTESINYFEGLMPYNFLPTLNQSNNYLAQQASQDSTVTLSDGIYNDILNNQVINFPIAYDQTYLQNLVSSSASASYTLPNGTVVTGNLEYNSLFRKNNFKSFYEFTNWFGFQYKPFSPPFSDSQQANYKYIYQQIIDLIPQTYSIFSSGMFGTNTSLGTNNSMSSIGNNANIPNLIRPEFNFLFNPSWDRLDFIGQKFDEYTNNYLPITIVHRDPSKYKDVIVQYEYFSISLLGPEDGVNSFNLGVPDVISAGGSLIGNDLRVADKYFVHFNVGDVSKTINIEIYKNWQVRSPIVLSLRPAKNPNQILQYLVIYLEEFYEIDGFSSNEYIDVLSFDKCRLMYNGFVNQKFDDNFLEKYRPDYIPLNYVNLPANSTGFSIISGFSPTNEITVNQKLFNIFNDSSLTLASLARRLNIPESAIYNIYINGSHYYEKNQASSDADITIVADTTLDVSYFNIGDIDFSLYNPRTFQFQLNEFAVPTFYDPNLLSDRNFFQYFTEEDTYKILQRIQFSTNITKDDFKNKAIMISDSHFKDSENYFYSKDLTKFKKKIWNSIRILILSVQYLKYGKVIDRKASNQYLEDTDLYFETFEDAQDYFLPILQDLKNQILSL